ncbi:STAS domain-containing protein [Kitasatospora sp. NPDC092039]|uniref:STAS domain-containing protein n=1 Tax=Kitasatospora sp. NPDC092039 TaxID=3364086 RepID=UPI0037F8C982
MSLTINRYDDAAGPVLRVTGDLDYEHAPDLRRYLDELTLDEGQRLVIDLAGLDFCDSSGITALLAARRLAHAVGADLALSAVPAKTLRVLAVVGLDRVFTIHADSTADG